MVQGHQRKFFLPLIAAKLSLQWLEIGGHAGARDYLPGGDEYTSQCQLCSLGDTWRFWSSRMRGTEGGRSWQCWSRVYKKDILYVLLSSEIRTYKMWNNEPRNSLGQEHLSLWGRKSLRKLPFYRWSAVCEERFEPCANNFPFTWLGKALDGQASLAKYRRLGWFFFSFFKL